MRCILVIVLVALSGLLFAQKPARVVKKLGDSPVFFIDSVNVDKSEIQRYQPEEIAAVSIYKNAQAIKLVGPDGKDGVVYIETKSFCKKRYWNYLKSKSGDYANIVKTPESDSSVQYILNGRILAGNFEGDLCLIDDSIFKNITIINSAELQIRYNVTNKTVGVLITSAKPDDLYKANKKF